MSFLLVPLAKVKQVLKIETTDGDAALEVMTSAASRAVLHYIDTEVGELFGIDSPPNSPPSDLAAVPEDIQIATILLVGHWNRDPDGDDVGAFDDEALPRVVRAVLKPYRIPVAI